MQRETVHKAVAAFISSFIVLLGALGYVLPEWVTPAGIDSVSWVAAAIASLFGSGIITGAVYQVRNKHRDPGDGLLGK